MEQPQQGDLTGLFITVILWAISNLLGLFGLITLAQAASAATFISACVVIIANAPKAYRAIKDFLKRKK